MPDFASDYYAMLGVPSGATLDEIRRAYRQLAKDLHPNLNPEHSNKRFQQINEAHRILSDGALRRQYDQALAQAAAMQAFRQRVRGRMPDVVSTVAQAWSKPSAFTVSRRRRSMHSEQSVGLSPRW